MVKSAFLNRISPAFLAWSVLVIFQMPGGLDTWTFQPKFFGGSSIGFMCLSAWMHNQYVLKFKFPGSLK